MGFPARLERTVPIAHPPEKVGRRSPRPRVWERVEEPAVFGFTWPTYGLPEDDPHRTYVEFTLEPAGPGTRLTVVETGFAQLPEDVYRKAYDGNTEGWAKELGNWPTTSMPPDTRPRAGPDVEAIAEQVFMALAEATRRATLAARGPATATDLAGRLPVTRQAIAKHLTLLAEADLVRAEPGERRRVRYRLRSAPMQVAQQFLAALTRDWDGPLDALKDHLDPTARDPATTPVHETRGHHG